MRKNVFLILPILLVVCQATAWSQEPKEYNGLIEPDELVSVSSPIAGVLDSVNFDKGDHVKKGDILASLKSGPERAAVNLAKAKYANKERSVERNRELFKQKLVSQHEQDDIETKALVAKMELRQAEEQLKQRIIRSPISGVVVDRKYSPGEYVQEHAIMKVARLNPLKVEVILPVAMFGQVHKGMPAQVRVPGYDGSFTGKVRLIDPIIDAASDSFAVEVELPNPKNALPAGLKCDVSFGVSAQARQDK